MEKSLFVKCICCCSALEISRDEEDNCFNVALWTNGPWGHKITSWREKLRWCWNMIKTGVPWNDHTILSNEDAAKLAEYINKRLNK